MKLREIRKSKNLTQQEIAKKLNLGRVNYNRYELEQVQPSIETLVKLADFYKVTVDELIGHDVPYLINKSQFSADQLAVIESIQKLDKEQIAKLIAYIDGLKDGKNR